MMNDERETHHSSFIVHHSSFEGRMPQVIGCPKCGQKMQVPDGSGGKQVRCPSCKTVFVVGAAAARQPVGAAAAAAPRPVPPPAPAAPPPAPAAPAGMKLCPA